MFNLSIKFFFGPNGGSTSRCIRTRFWIRPLWTLMFQAKEVNEEDDEVEDQKGQDWNPCLSSFPKRFFGKKQFQHTIFSTINNF